MDSPDRPAPRGAAPPRVRRRASCSCGWRRGGGVRAPRTPSPRTGDDEAHVGRKNLARPPERGGEKQPVAMQAIIEPLLVGAKVRDRRLDLDDPQFAVG